MISRFLIRPQKSSMNWFLWTENSGRDKKKIDICIKRKKKKLSIPEDKLNETYEKQRERDLKYVYCVDDILLSHFSYLMSVFVNYFDT